MTDRILITCITDLKDSTPDTETLGHQNYLPEVEALHALVRRFADLTGGTYVNDTGDGDVITFEGPLKAIEFASLLQSYYRTKPALLRRDLQIRVGIFDGAVREVADNIRGSGVNQAARLQALAEPGQIIINDSLSNHLRPVLGRDEARKYITDLGAKNLKGITEPPEQNVYSFDWLQYQTDTAGKFTSVSLPKLVSDHLKDAAVDILNVKLTDLANPGAIVWPAVPRRVVTAIHRGQVEIIRLLALLGWRVHLLIEDCSAKGEYPKEYSDAFRDKLKAHLERRGLKLDEIQLLSEYYNPTNPNYNQIHSIFRTVTSEVKLAELELINNKDYDLQQREDIKNAPTLDFLRPALSMAAVIYLANQMDRKAIVVSGADEKMQWRCSQGIGDTMEKIGMIMNPVLLNKQDQNFQAFQRDTWPIWQSESELAQEMTTGEPNNLAWWVFCLHAFLPSFPDDTVQIGGSPIRPKDWTDREHLPESLQPADLARHVWPILET